MRPARVMVAASALALAAGAGPVTAPAWAFTVDQPVLQYTSYFAGDGLVQPAIVPLFPTPAVSPGLPVAATIRPIDYEGGRAVSYVATWLRCSPRNQPSASCTVVNRAAGAPGADPSGKTFLYSPTSDDVGGYLRFALTVESKDQAGAARAPITATNAPGTELLVVPVASAGGVEAKGALTPGAAVPVEAYVWNIPQGSAFLDRTIAAYACANPAAGQAPGVSFDATGCTNISANLRGDFSSSGSSTGSLLLPLNVGGTHLLFDETLRMRTNGLLTVYKRRSATQAISGAGGSVGPVPTPAPSPSPNPDAGGGSQQGGTPNDGGAGQPSASASPSAVPPVDPTRDVAAGAGIDIVRSPIAGTAGTGTYRGVTLKLKTRAVQARGHRQRLTATIRPKMPGTVMFVLTRSGAGGSVIVAKTKVAKVRKGKAAITWTVKRKKPAGAYVVFAVFTPRRGSNPGLTVARTITVT